MHFCVPLASRGSGPNPMLVQGGCIFGIPARTTSVTFLGPSPLKLRGVPIAYAGCQVVRHAPPLCIRRKEADQLVDIVAASIDELEAELT